MEVTSADVTRALTVPVVRESEVRLGLPVTDGQAGSLDKRLLELDRKKLWHIRATDAQAFFQTGKSLSLITSPMIAVLDQSLGETYREKSGFIRNLGNAQFEARLVHEYLHATLHFANQRRLRAMRRIGPTAYTTPWSTKAAKKLSTQVSTQKDRDALEAKLEAVGALKKRLTFPVYERPPVYPGKTDEEVARLEQEWRKEKAAKRKEAQLARLVLGLVRFEDAHRLRPTGQYAGKTKGKLDKMAPNYVGGGPLSCLEHQVIGALGVVVASGTTTCP